MSSNESFSNSSSTVFLSSLFFSCFDAGLGGDGLAEGLVDFDSVPCTVLWSCFLCTCTSDITMNETLARFYFGELAICRNLPNLYSLMHSDD